MKPIIFSIGDIHIQAFFFMIMIGTLLGTFYMYWLAKKENLRLDVILDIGIIGMIAGVLGARIFHVLVENPSYYMEDPVRFFQFWRGGFVSYGAIIAIPISILVYVKKREIEAAQKYFDVIVAATPVVAICVRTACLLAGCCYGKPTNFPWAIKFTAPGTIAFIKYPNIPLHPTQVYNLILTTIIFFAVNWIYRHRKFDMQTSWSFVIMYSISRFITEFFRGDMDRGVYFGNLISTGQIVSIFGLMLGISMYIFSSRKYGKNQKENTN